MDFLYNFDCILNTRKNCLLCLNIGETLKSSSLQRSNKNLFFVAAEDNNLLYRCKDLMKSRIFDEEGSKTQQIEVIVEPI